MDASNFNKSFSEQISKVTQIKGNWYIQGEKKYPVAVHTATNTTIYCPCAMDSESTRALFGRVYCDTEKNVPYSDEHMQHWNDFLKNK